jgi:hypothetical protein
VVKETGWTIDQVSKCTMYQLKALINNWYPQKKKSKPSSPEEIKNFIKMMKH